MTDPLPNLSAAAWSVWGKSDGFEGNDWMPLARHLADSADVASYVWDWLPVHTRTFIEEALPEGARDGRRLLQWLAGVHDIGKCSPPFAAKVPALADRMAEHGLRTGDPTGYARAFHGPVGHLVLERWLGERHGFTRPTARSYVVVVGGHHGSPPTQAALEDLRARPHLLGEGRWREVQDELLDAVAERLDMTGLLTRWRDTRLGAGVQAVLTGAVIVSDWLASNEEFFPFHARTQEGRAEDAWARLRLPAPWTAQPPPRDVAHHLADRFPALVGLTPRTVQQLTAEAAWATETPSLLIVEAEMGSGKTEAALLAAEVLAARFGCGGVYVALPTMATSDAMFNRVLDWIAQLHSDPTSTHLAHGKAGLNDAYRGLLSAASRIRGVYDDDRPAPQTEARVAAWLAGRKRGVLANMVVGTIDQLLMTALQAKHVALRHLAFAGKVVVVDEAHAADDYMRTYLARTLEWLASYGVPVVLMSATLPRAQRQELADAYRRGLGAAPAPLPDESPYPALTQVSRSGIEVRGAATPDPGPGTTVTIRCLDDDPDTLTAALEELLADGGCAAVIRNTVGRAQDVAALLRERLPGTEVVLAHSRFVATHRVAREARLRELLGRTSTTRPERLVVVGTQVLEQSLDIDFDVMATDLAPVDLVLQRVGRLHRHVRTGRPAPLASPQLLVTGIDDWEAGVPTPVRAFTNVYDASRLLRSAAVLGLSTDGAAAITLPDDIRPLVETAYADDPPGPLSWHPAIAEADRRHQEKVVEQRDRADLFRIAPVDDTPHLVNWLAYGSHTEADDPRAPGASRVRDSEDGLEVVVVLRRTSGEVVHLEDGSPYAGRLAVFDHGPPDQEVARALAATTVRLPLSMTSGREYDRTVAALEAEAHVGWQESRWLSGHLALHLDEQGRAVVGRWQVAYDDQTGLTVTAVQDRQDRVDSPGSGWSVESRHEGET